MGRSAAEFLDRAAEEARYRLHRNDLADSGYRGFLEAFIARALLPFAPPGSAILDYGSGPVPALARLLRAKGFTVECFDPFFAPSVQWKKKRFALVALHETAEHLKYPKRSLAAVARALGPGGALAIRTRFLPEKVSAFDGWWYKDDMTHVGFFSRRSFERLSADLGLELALLEEPDLAVLRKP